MKVAAVRSSLTILFEDPFWIGLCERIEGKQYTACKITFGAEPKDYEVYAFLLANWQKLRFSPPVKTEQAAERRVSPKRMQREISDRLRDRGVGTKAQQALKLQQEQGKLARRLKTREQKEAEKDRQFALRQERKKAKHRGR